ncbi:azurin [Zunongwangia pacifica]|uniref:Azurin n=1 Tax=Zunongwangia pacifica TaxID=2911062 RepID=A0A9X1ZN10_9FLAO|nr:azurin [Zunongwangia pacifica]MCL6217011.1 azurin [Zunongwangia pacifica]
MKYCKRIFLGIIALAVMSCGEKKEEKEKITIGDNNSTSSAITTKAKASDEEKVVEVFISANDQMQFSKNEIKVEAGNVVRLTLKHTGEMNEKVMGHNFVLLTQGTDISAFGQKAMTAGAEKNYIPEDGKQVIAHTEIIGGGESTTIEFKAPKAGRYDFICSFPGHYAVMQGKFIVE